MNKREQFSPPLYLLYAENLGAYSIRNRDDEGCVFLFTSRESVIRFGTSLVACDQQQFTAIRLGSTRQILDFLGDIKHRTQFLAIDPVTESDFSPVKIDNFIALQLRDL